MKTRAVILSLLLVVFSSSFCIAATPGHSGINQAALASVKPVFGPWIWCNKVLDNNISDYLNGQYSLARDVPRSSRYCDAAYSVADGIRLKGNLAGNAAMKKALGALSHLLYDKAALADQLEKLFDCFSDGRPPPCVYFTPTDEIKEMERIVDQLIVKVESDRSLSTRFWYYLDHTA